MILVSILLALVSIGFMAVLITAYRLSRTKQHKALLECELFLDRLHKMCLEARDVEPFAGALADEILNHRIARFNKTVEG